MSQNIARVLDAYEGMINDPDEEGQHAAAREALADDFRFVGPRLGEVAGRAAMVKAIGVLRERAPSETMRIRRTTAIDEHNGWLRFGWEFVDGQGAVLAQGIDVSRIGPDGRLLLVVPFFGELQPHGDERATGGE